MLCLSKKVVAIKKVADEFREFSHTLLLGT